MTIPGQGFVLVFASGKDRTDPQGELHTNFNLDRDGEYRGTFTPDTPSPDRDNPPCEKRDLPWTGKAIPVVDGVPQE